MIREIRKDEIQNCVEVICKSFMTVADEVGFTVENAPGFTAFATTENRLIYQMEQEQRQMFAFCEDGKIAGYYLLEHAFAEAKKLGCSQLNIGIVEENVKLRKWYKAHGVEHIGTENMISFLLPVDI